PKSAMPLRPRLSAAVAAALMCLGSACQPGEAVQSEQAEGNPEIGLMGTIPIYWGEAGDFGEVMAGDSAAHWARPRLEAHFRLRPIDSLAGPGLAGLDYLLLAQPRALSPAENVALDNWVRGGGKVLLFADPMLTGESRFAIGDRRRPQDVILLSPILARWGLELTFDDTASPEYRLVPTAGAPIPVNLPGTLFERDGQGECTIAADNLLADCAVGRGRAVIVADAAVL